MSLQNVSFVHEVFKILSLHNNKCRWDSESRWSSIMLRYQNVVNNFLHNKYYTQWYYIRSYKYLHCMSFENFHWISISITKQKHLNSIICNWNFSSTYILITSAFLRRRFISNGIYQGWKNKQQHHRQSTSSLTITGSLASHLNLLLLLFLLLFYFFSYL